MRPSQLMTIIGVQTLILYDSPNLVDSTFYCFLLFLKLSQTLLFLSVSWTLRTVSLTHVGR